MAFSKKATDALSQEYSIPGHQSYQTNQQITSQFGGGGDGAPLVVVVSLPAGQAVTSPAVTTGLNQLTTRVEQAVPGSRVASYATTSDSGFVAKDGRTTFIVDYPPPEPGQYGQSPLAEKAVQAAIKGQAVGGGSVALTGYDALTAQAGSGAKGASVFVESLIGGFGALIVLAFVFASFLALVPLVIALVSIMTSFLAVWGLAEATSVSSIVEYLIALVGLGIAIDYSLLIVVRWREARARGLSGEDAVVEAMATAGRAVVFSGTAVGVGLLCLIVMPVPFLRSLGFGGLLIPIVSVAVTLTLLPVMLAKIGPRLDWPHRRADAGPARAWTRWSGFVVKHRWASAIVALAIMGALAGAATTLTLGPANGNPDTLSQAGTAKDALNTLNQSGIGEGALTPIEILAPRADGPRLVHALSGLAGVQGATAPTAASWSRGDTAIVDVFTHDNSPAALASVRDAAHAVGPNVTVGGIDAQNRDFISAVYGSFPLMVILIAILGYILLARAFRSLILPLKAVALNILSVAASWGALTLIWQKGFGSHALWGIPALGSIPSWLPVIVFAFLFGLSMDYEVFILSRIREEHDRGASNHDAILAGMGRTGRLVTSAALILFLGFVAMSTAPGPVVKAMATGFGVGIIVDATVVRALLVPALVSIFGDWSWRFPRAAAKILFVPDQRAPVEAAPEYDRAGGPAS
ncbi:MAG TPA: MMPL family transporter [Trebonia sp.]|jgi:RND superfamily putative drug exporter|nr:MMPL family transporter [Trebonia sp.]